MGILSESETLRVEVVVDKAEGAIGEEIGRCVDVVSVFGAQGERCVGEAVGWDVWDGSGEDGRFGGREGAWWGRVVIGMIGTEERSRWQFRERPQPRKEGFGRHCGVSVMRMR